MEEQPRTYFTHFGNNNFGTQNEKTLNPKKTCVQSCCREKILRTRNCRRKFIKNLLPEKPKENM